VLAMLATHPRLTPYGSPKRTWACGF
jgi:hypothetical protein